MSVTKTIEIRATNGVTWASTDEWIAEHGHCGTASDHEFVSEGELQLLEGGVGVKVILTYVSDAAVDAHRASTDGKIFDDILLNIANDNLDWQEMPTIYSIDNLGWRAI
jgi:hypothetical protein